MDVSTLTRRPIRLPANPIRRFYRGTGRLVPDAEPPGAGPGGEAGGAPSAGAEGPAAAEGPPSEEWIGSTTAAAGTSGRLGLSRLPDGTVLADAIREHPAAFLGAAHVGRFGPGTELLVKYLDPGQRLPVHCHPGRGFAREHLGCRHGKNEAWIIADAPAEGGEVFLGFRDDVPLPLLHDLVAAQDTDRLLGSLNRVRVRRGDAIFVPAGVPHAIGAGLLVVELQEPTDFSIMLEWRGYATGEDTGLGLDRETGLRAVDRSGWTPERLAGLSVAPGDDGGAPPGTPRRLLPPAADDFFRAELIPSGGPITLDAGFAILVVLDGRGTLTTAGGHADEIAAGDRLLVPYACGELTLTGTATAIRCRPPAP